MELFIIEDVLSTGCLNVCLGCCCFVPRPVWNLVAGELFVQR